MANVNFDEFIDNLEVFCENATNDSVMSLFLVSARRASRHAGTDVMSRTSDAVVSGGSVFVAFMA